MRYSEEVFELIKTLTKTEKRYFKVHGSSFRKKNNMLRLFDAIEKQKSYDEQKILTLFQKETFAKQLHVVKNNLLELVLKSMQGFYIESSVDARLRSMLNQIEILFNKDCIKSAEKMIEKGKALALRYESDSLLIEFLNHETGLHRIQLFNGKTVSDNERIFKEINNANERIMNVANYNLLVSNLFLLLNKYGSRVRSNKEFIEYKKIMRHPLLQSESKAIAFVSKIAFHLCYSIYHDILNDYDKALPHISRQVELFESIPDQRKKNPKSYGIMLNNYVIALFHLKKYKEASLVIEKLRANNVGPFAWKQEKKLRLFNLELSVYIALADFDKGIELVNSIEKEIRNYQMSASQKMNEMLMYYQIAYIYFGKQKYVLANKYLNKILFDDEFQNNIRVDILCFAKILTLITNFELRKQDLLEYSVKSTYRFLFKRERLYKIETIILTFIRKRVPNIEGQREQVGAFKELKSQFEKLAKDPYENKAFEYFDFISWLESKIQKRSFAEIVKEKSASIN